MVVGDTSGSGGCRSSLVLGGGGTSSGGRGTSSGGRGSSGHNSNKASNSGGGAKKKAGWEDADVEFYREAYPMAPPDSFSQCQKLATLLPSTRCNGEGLFLSFWKL